jgi:putative membrane protein
MIRTYRHTMLLLSALALGSCAMNGASSDGMSQQKSGSRAQRETGAQMKAQDTSAEARLLGFLNVANKGDLEGGRLAQERGESMAVKTYGRQMEGDHMQMLQESEGTATRLGLVPATGPEAQPLIQEHEKTMHKLQAVSGKDFDQLYLSHEVQMHQRVLQTVATLAGQTHDPQLTQIVAGARPILEAHLKAAQRLLAEQQ